MIDFGLEVARRDIAVVFDAGGEANLGSREASNVGLNFESGGKVMVDVVLENGGVGLGGDDGDGGTVAGKEPGHVDDRNYVAGGEQREDGDSEFFVLW